MVVGTRNKTNWKNKSKVRCWCGKRAKDIIEGVPLCRIHSPEREGFIKNKKKK